MLNTIVNLPFSQTYEALGLGSSAIAGSPVVAQRVIEIHLVVQEQPGVTIMPVAPPPVHGAEIEVDIEARIERAEGVLTRLLERQMPVCCSWSAGKDSSTVLNLLLSAASRLAAEKGAGFVPPIVVTHADTMIENPEMVSYARAEMAQVRAFAKLHGLNVSIEISVPNLTDRWAVRVIGGRALPPFPGTNRDCSMDWKVSPMKRLRKQVIKSLKSHCDKVKIAGVEASGFGNFATEPVVLLGTRYDESSVRSANMKERGESDIEVRRGIDENGKASSLFLSPICFWTTDDVWEYLAMARGKLVPAYSTFEETFRVYADAMGTSCVIVAEDMNKSMKASKACGARFGCSLCTAVGKDQSMENMLDLDDRYAYMQGLNQLRNFLSATRWDLGRRSWVGRTIHAGHIRIAPDAYSPAMMEELLRYSLTIDEIEKSAAARAGVRPRFELIGIEQLFAIDAYWSLQAFHRPYHALAIWDDVVNKRARYPIPLVDTFARTPMPAPRYIPVGIDWDNGYDLDYTGLRSVTADMAAFDSDAEGGCMGTRTTKAGRDVMAVNVSGMFQVEIETACFLLFDQLDELLAVHNDGKSCPTTAYLRYASLGLLSLKSGIEGEVDGILKRSSFKARNDLAGMLKIDDVLARSISAAEAGVSASTNGKKRVRGAEGSLSVAAIDLSGAVNENIDGAYSSSVKTTQS